ncbi:hypothetical protein ACJ5NV_00115 [Loktanella agnita]|uniref:hypothetical protein n=1 Tax=Loktanella agnita TaxID=287097 RepID=UPI003985F3ED
MTALDKYVRLESGGLWRADAQAQRKDVAVSFGDATLVIADGAGRPVAHWSLPAILRQNPGVRPAVFAPDTDAEETLEIADDLMIDAIEEVRKALDKARPKPGKLRHWITAGIVMALLALAIFWLPGALTRQTLAVVPQTKRVEIGAAMLGYIQTENGSLCREPRATAAAAQLAQRLFGAETDTQIIVVPDLAQGSVAIPGRIILLDSGVLTLSDDPAVAAGYILAARATAQDHDPLDALLQRAGLRTTFRLLTTGEVPAEILQENAQAIVAAAPPIADPASMDRVFAAARVPMGPYLATRMAPGETVPRAAAAPDAPAILNDSDWVRLQNICNR